METENNNGYNSPSCLSLSFVENFIEVLFWLMTPFWLHLVCWLVVLFWLFYDSLLLFLIYSIVSTVEFCQKLFPNRWRQSMFHFITYNHFFMAAGIAVPDSLRSPGAPWRPLCVMLFWSAKIYRIHVLEVSFDNKDESNHIKKTHVSKHLFQDVSKVQAHPILMVFAFDLCYQQKRVTNIISIPLRNKL